MNEPEEVLPEFREIVDRETAGLVLEPRAERMVENLLQTGSRAVRDANPSIRDQIFDEAKEGLGKVVHSAVIQLRERIDTTDRRVAPTVDAASLAEVMQMNCPFPPFCPLTGGASGDAQ
ncbi:hypothetical protein ACIBEA_14330 [Streptomyces sp. NPDC051555]|uniref:hypothetical protein n=1 Tax=Streptomyces sp. NPDC051555 TaxID=3365657 RepID=UPI0037965E42